MSRKLSLFFPFPTPNVRATFLARPQRFLVRAKLENGEFTRSYCANPGSLAGCLRQGSQIILWESPVKTRRCAHTWRAIKLSRTWVGTDTHLANRLVRKAIEEGRIASLKGFSLSKAEPRAKEGRLDFLLKRGNDLCFVEVKSATVACGKSAQFPDSLSPRAVRHLRSLKTQAEAGHRAVLIFVAQRGDVTSLCINHQFDPKFSAAMAEALAAGVEVVALKFAVNPRGFRAPVAIPLRVADLT